VVVLVSVGAEVELVVPGVEVDDVASTVVDVDVDVEDDVVSTVEVLVVGTMSGAPAAWLTSPDAAATTHQAASVTSSVANSHPRTYLVVLIDSSSLRSTHVCISEVSRFSQDRSWEAYCQ
jgi:hypothetical protein